MFVIIVFALLLQFVLQMFYQLVVQEFVRYYRVTYNGRFCTRRMRAEQMRQRREEFERREQMQRRG